MGGVNIPLLALDVKQPEAPSLLDTLGKASAIKGQQQQQQLVAQQIKDNDAIRQALTDWNPQSSYDDLAHAVVKNGGSGNAAFQIMQHGLAVKKQVSDIAKQDADTGGQQLQNLAARHDQALGAIKAAEDVPDDQLGAHVTSTVSGLVQSGMLKPEEAQPYAQLAQLPPDQMRAQLKLHEKQLMGEKAQIAQAQTFAETAKNTAQAGQATAETGKINAETEFYKKQGLAPGVTPEMASYADYLKSGGQPKNYAAWKAKQEAAATQPFKIQTAQAEAQARFAMEGMAKPVYAYDPKTNSTQLMDQTSALRAGLQPRPVTTKEIQDDTMLNNRLADVHQKIARYEQALQQPLSSHGLFSTSDSTKIAQILGDDKFKAGAFGTELPVDFINKIGQKNLQGNLSDPAVKRLIAYYNAREAMVGYQRVLSGSGRSSEQAMQLNLQTLPSPISPENFSKESLNQFKENLRIVGQGLPKIPGIKSPEEWEQQINQTNPQKQAVPPPAGATHTAMGSDGNRHYTNSKGQDLGIAQ